MLCKVRIYRAIRQNREKNIIRHHTVRHIEILSAMKMRSKEFDGRKKYLKWYNKIGYGSGDIAGNVVYAFLTSFMMVYLTDSVGLAAGVVGTPDCRIKTI